MLGRQTKKKRWRVWAGSVVKICPTHAETLSKSQRTRKTSYRLPEFLYEAITVTQLIIEFTALNSLFFIAVLTNEALL